MPRGKKRTALQVIDEQIQKVDADIEKYQAKIKGLETKKQELLKQKKESEINTLYEKIQASGKSVEDLLSALDNE